ncbi:hypothetical protein GQR58_006876 [Nymphon striatum]|nr:hypothetical protein GQR58_006876 [Nymphon striatum]
MVKTSNSATINAPGTINYTFTFTNTGNVVLNNLDIDDPDAVVTGCPIATLAVGASDSCSGTRTINYTFTFTNTGNVALSNLDITDPDAVVSGCPIATLAVGASDSCTGTRVITQAQIDAGVTISNTAIPNVEYPLGTSIPEDNSVDNTATTIVTQTPAFNMVKTSDSATISAPGTINYTFTFTNTGNVALSNLDIDDPNAILTGCPIATLAVGASDSCTGTRVITQAQIDAGTAILNTAMPSAEDPSGTAAPEDNTADNTTTTTVDQTPSFNMVKTSNSATISAPGTINYTFTFTNTGNVALSNLDIDDPDALVTGCPIATLAVGASDSCTGTRVITQAQIDTGAAILNTAVPSAEDPSGTAVPEDNTADNTTTTTVDQTPSYNMVKTSDSATMNAPGTINYTFTFTNTGNVALSNLDIDDPDAVVTGCPITTLAVGASDSCTGTRVITQAQIDAGAAILNTATPSAEDPLGTAAPEDNTADNTTTTTVDQTPGYNMVKTSDSETISAPGTINYTFTFTNTGNVALSNLDIDDPDAVVTGCPITTLAVGASESCTGSRVITQAQINAGVAIPNTATPSAEDPLGTAAPEDNTADNTTTTTIIQTPSYNMVKNSDTTIINAPGTINYTFTFTNTGNVALSNLDIDDPDAVVTGCPIATLAVGATDTCAGTRVITQAQIDAGEAILNTATSSALDPADGEVLEVNLSDNTVTTVVEVTSHITVIKSDASLTDDADSSTNITLGDTLSYTVTATNDGNTTLNNVVVSDPKLEPTSFTCLTVAPNASCVLSGTHVIDIDESNAGNVVNTASVVSDEITTSVSSNTVTTPVVQTLEYTMAKTSDTADIGVPGVITYTFTFTNTGNVDLTELTVEDTNIDTGTLNNCPIARLAPGEIATCTATRTISSAQISAGDDITNTAIPSAKGPDGITFAVEDNTANDNTTTTTVTTWADVSVTKTLLTTGPYTSGQVITYEIVVTNSASSWSDATNVIVNDLPTNLNVTNVSKDFTVTGTVTSGNTSNASDTGTVTITDNDTPAMSVGDVTIAEDGGSASVPVSIDNPSSVDTVVTITTTDNSATDPNDYTTTTTTVTIPAGQTTVNVAIPVHVDTVVTITTTDNSAEDPADYTTTTTTVTIPAGQTTVNVAIPVIDDTTGEPTEDFTVTGTVTSGNTSNASDTGTVTITDNDTPAMSVGDVTLAEDGGSASVPVSIDNPSSVDTVVTITTTDNSAADPADYTTTTTTVTIPAGQTTVNVAIPVIDDTTGEPTEDFTVTGTVTSGNTSNPSDTGTVTITDNDTPAMTVGDVTLAEDGGSASVPVSIDNPSSVDTVVTITTTDNSAEDPADYTTTTTTVTIPAGQTTVNVAIPVIDDTTGEPTEDFTVTGTVTSGNTSNPSDTGTVTITDNDTPAMSVGDVTIAEDGGSASVPVSIDNPSSITVQKIHADYTTTTTTVTIPAGQTTVNVAIPVIDDTTGEPTEDFTVTGTVTSGNTSNPVIPERGNTSNASDTGTVTITDNDTPAMSVGDVTLAEDGGSASVPVSIDNPSSVDTVVTITTTDNSATDPTDYTTTTTTVTIPAGQTTVNVAIPVIDDTTGEPTEDFTVTGTVTSGNTSNASDTGTVTITDNDTPAMSVGDVTLAEDGGSASVPVSIDNPSSGGYGRDDHHHR